MKIADKTNNNELNKDYSMTINVGHTNSKKILDKNIRLQKKVGKKRNTFSPDVDRELLNQKQSEVLNYSVEARKIE